MVEWWNRTEEEHRQQLRDEGHIIGTTEEAQNAWPNGTKVRHLGKKRQDRTGRITGSQWHDCGEGKLDKKGRRFVLLYCTSWDDRQHFPWIVEDYALAKIEEA